MVFHGQLKMSRFRSNLLILLSCIWLLAIGTTHADAPTARTRNGTLAGSMMRTRLGRDFVSFRGIPYATPPLGELRFQPPKPATAWSGVRSAQDDAAICTQRNSFTHDSIIMGVEDCLYLNVYTPKVPSEEEASTFQRFPVMIWFHGGGWITGAGHSAFYGPKFLLDHDVVLVTVNYRLGPLGFLSTEDMECPGNMGLKDQAQSIRWVHENIVSFGGDPNRVTIFGESAGGASVHYHMISPLSQGLFHRAISQSGNSYCPWTLTKSGIAKKRTNILGEHLNCPTGSSKELLACLRTKKAADIINSDKIFHIFGYCPLIPFRPVVEPDHPGAFLKEDPVVATKQGRIADIPWMMGVTSEEGSLKVPSIYGMEKNEETVKKLDTEFMKLVPMSLLYEDTCPKSRHDEVTKKIRQFYFGDRSIDESTRHQVIDMYSDAWFIHGIHMGAQDFLKIQSSPIYYYYFTYRGSISFSTIFGDPNKDYGVSHADDLQYLFPVGEVLFKDTTMSKEDLHMVDVMTSLWFNFANSANPTPKITKTIPVKWKPVRTSHAIEYLQIGNSKVAMDQDLLPKRMKFWDSLPVRVNLETASGREAKDEL